MLFQEFLMKILDKKMRLKSDLIKVQGKIHPKALTPDVKEQFSRD